MNNLYKSLKLSALIAAVIGLAACQKSADIVAVETEIANNTIQGIYTYLAIDTTAVNTTLYEWQLDNDSLGRKGSYRVAATGNGKDENSETALTWQQAIMSEDGLSMSIPVSVAGTEKVLKWHDGVVSVDGYTTDKDLISKVSVLRTVHENFANLDFVYSDTSYYITTRKDTVYYLAWRTEVVSWPQDSIDAYKLYLLTMVDTIAWFNATYPNRAVPDTVRFSTKPQKDGTYKGQISRAYEDKEIKEIQTNHGPLLIINSEMVYNRTGLANTGYYLYHEESWTEECYTDPTSKKAVHVDYTENVTDAKWTPCAFTNIKKFNIMLKGTWTIKNISETAGGDPVVNMDKTHPNFLCEVSLYGFNKTDGEVFCGELKYKTK